MADVEICAPDRDTMVEAAKLIGAWDEESQTFRNGGITPTGILWAMNVYGAKTIPTGNMLTDADGNQTPELQTFPGFYAVGRWMSDESFPLLPGVVIIPIPDDSPMRFA